MQTKHIYVIAEGCEVLKSAIYKWLKQQLEYNCFKALIMYGDDG